MIRFLIRTAIFIGSSALGLWLTSLIVDGFHVKAEGFLVAVLVFAVLQSILSPFFLKATARNASALTGAVGLISTFVALLVAPAVNGSITIAGPKAWLFGTILVWLVTMLATLLLPVLLVKDRVEKNRAAG